MQRNMKQKIPNRILLFLLINIVVLITIVINGSIYVSAADNNDVSIDKVNYQIDINDAFDGSSVIIVLNRQISGINKVHNNLFKDIEYTVIEDLSIVTDESSIADVDNFEQILKITLLENSKQNVLNVIEKLSQIEGVKYAGPNRIFKVGRTPNDPLYTHLTTPEFG